MSKKVLIPLGVVVILAMIDAKEASNDSKLVEVGSSYLISNGTAAMKGKVVSDLGGGWYSVLRSDGGGVMSVNVANAFFIQELKK
jgi:hypothetical protein